MNGKMIFLTLALAALPVSATAQDKVMRLYAWEQLFPQALLDKFTAETGYSVTYDSYDSDETLETKLLSGDTGYDVVVPSATPFLAREILAGAMEPLDKAKVPNFANQTPELLELLKRSDPTLAYAGIGGWGTTTLGYDADAVRQRIPDAPLDSYDLIFKPEYVSKLADCGVALVDSPTDIIPLVLNYLGLDPNTQSLEDMNKAMALLDSIRPYIILDKGTMATDMALGNVCAGIGYSGDFVQAKMRSAEAGNGINVQYTIPKEGTMAWISAIAIPKNPPNPDAANAFVNFMLSPQAGAAMTLNLGYANGVQGSRELVAAQVPELAADPIIFPEGETLARLFTMGLVEDKLNRERNRAWTKLRAGE